MYLLKSDSALLSITNNAHPQIEEGATNRFQTFSVIVGDCVNEDKSLGLTYTSPGLENVSTNLFTMPMLNIHGFKVPQQPPQAQ